MNLHITKSKNAESFYIAKSYVKANGCTSSAIVRKLGTLNQLIVEHGPTRDDVLAWAKNEVKLETERYKKEKEAKTVLIPFHADRQLDYDKQTFYRGGYLFLQSIYYGFQMNKTCRKLKAKYKFKYDINAILSDLIYARVLEPASKRSSFKTASEFMEKPAYELHDVYRALDVLGNECDFIQSEVYKNSHFIGKRNDQVLYCDCTNYYFEIEQEDGDKKYGKSKEHRPNPIIQMGLFMDGDGIPLAFSLFPGNTNEQKSLKPLEQKVIGDFGCQKFIYCSDAGLASEDIRTYNHLGERAFIVTQSIKKLPAEDKTWALNKSGFKRVADDMPVDITALPDDDTSLYYKEEPYTLKKLHQRLIITYSPKYAHYQKTIREKQVERAEKMISSGNTKKQRKNPNDPGRFIGTTAVTEDGEAAKVHTFLDENKIAGEAMYDGLYAVCTDLLDDDVSGTISHDRFLKLSAEYEAEQRELKEKVKADQQEVDTYEQNKSDFDSFAAIIRKYVGIKELTPTIVNEFIKKIIVHAPEKVDGKRVQKVDIVFNFVGEINFLSATSPKCQGA